MTSATDALQSLEAHRQVLDKERNDMKDDVAFLRDLRRRYTLPLSELPPCKGLPAPVASSARKFLVETEAYIMRRISANQKQDAEIGNQVDQLRGTIQQTANIAHQIAGTTPSQFALAPGTFYGGNNGHHQQHFGGGAQSNSSVATHIQTPSYNFVGGGGNINNQPQIGFSEALGTPGGASRFQNVNRLGGASPMPQPQQQQFVNRGPSVPFSNYGGASSSSFSGAPNNAEIGFEAPLGVLPYMSAAAAAYRQQQALAYLAADQGVLPRGWAPAPLNPQPLVPYTGGSSRYNNNNGARSSNNNNMSPSRMRAMEMNGGLYNDGTTFVVLPRASSTERPSSVNKRRAGSASRKN